MGCAVLNIIIILGLSAYFYYWNARAERGEVELEASEASTINSPHIDRQFDSNLLLFSSRKLMPPISDTLTELFRRRIFMVTRIKHEPDQRFVLFGQND